MTGSYNDSLESSPVQDTYTRGTLSTQTSFLGSNPRSVPLRVSQVAQMVKNLPAVQETWGGGGDPLEKGMATHCSILAWRIPMDSGAWRAAVQGITKSQIRLSTADAYIP